MARYKQIHYLTRTGSFTNTSIPNLVYEMEGDHVVKNNETYIDERIDWYEVHNNMTPDIYIIDIRCLVLTESTFLSEECPQYSQ